MQLDLCGGSDRRQRVTGLPVCAHARRCAGSFALLIAEALGADPEVSDPPTALEVCFRAAATNVFLQEEDGATFFFCV